MRRRLFIIAIFLLAGAAVNVAVAWGCGAFIDPFEHDYRLIPRRGSLTPMSEWKKWWAVHSPDGFPATPLAAAQSSAFGVTRTRMWDPKPDGLGDYVIDSVVHLRTGWPIRSMGGAEWHDAAGQVTFEAAVVLPFSLGFLPMRPQWRGFAINTPFYTTILWLITCGTLALWRVLLRLLRLRRGLCPKCAYPMGESSVCSECGKDLPKRVRPAT